jgi:hypothetical protein
MAFSFVETTSSGSTSVPFSFSYLNQTEIKVYVNGVEDTAKTFASANVLTLSTAPAVGATVRVERTTNIATRSVDFKSGSILTEADLDNSAQQVFNAVQETVDKVGTSVAVGSDGLLDANNNRIKNVANPVNDQDAATKHYLENVWLTTANKTALTTINTNIANINAVNTNESNINSAVTNATNITDVATDIDNVNSVAAALGSLATISTNATNINFVAGKINPTDYITPVAGAATAIGHVGGQISPTNNIATVAGAISPTNNIATVATDISSVNTTATNITQVQNVSGAVGNMTTLTTGSNLANIATVAGQISPTNNISTVAAKATEIGALGVLGSEITALSAATPLGNLTLLGTSDMVDAMGNLGTAIVTGHMAALNGGTVIADMAALNTGTLLSDITDVAGVATNIGALDATVRGHITTVAGYTTELSNINTSIAHVQSVADDLAEATSEIHEVGTNIASVNTVGTAITDGTIGNVITNLSSINNFGQQYRVSVSAPTTSLDAGDLWYDTTNNALKVYGSSGWATIQSNINATANRYDYIVGTNSGSYTNGSTITFPATYDVGFLDVYVNGIKQQPADFTATNGTSITLGVAASTGDSISVIGYGNFTVAAVPYASVTGTPTLATVATTGAYADVTGTPTLATVATSGAYADVTGTANVLEGSGVNNAAYDQLTPKSTEITGAIDFNKASQWQTMTGHTTFAFSNVGTISGNSDAYNHTMLVLDRTASNYTIGWNAGFDSNVPPLARVLKWATGTEPTWTDYQIWHITLFQHRDNYILGNAVGYS